MGSQAAGVAVETVEFFSLVLPDEGFRCIVTPNPKGTGMVQMFFENNEQAASASQRIDAKGATVYFGCATFVTAGNRKSENALGARSFWLDIDCGAGKPYANAREGVIALHAFCAKVGLPLPLIVASGVGLHVYWTLTESIDADTWRETAHLLRSVAQHHELRVDNSRTTDIASILRPVGSHHRKADPKRVKVVHAGSAVEHKSFHETLQEHVLAQGVVGQDTSSGPSLNSDLIGEESYPPAYGERIVNGCGVVRHMRDEQGNVDQPTWYAVLGVLAFCEDGEELAHEWSSGHPQYTKRETAFKLAQASKYKPTTCAKMSGIQPDICAVCPHAGKIRSPIALGFVTPEVPVKNEQDEVITLPDGYRYAPFRQGMEPTLQYSLIDGDGNTVWIPFCDTLFYPISRIKTPEGYQMELEMHVRAGQKRRFTLDCGTIARGGSDLAYELGRREIVPLFSKMKPQIDQYMHKWMDRLRTRAEEISTFHHYGWHEDGFLIGKSLITETGERQVLLSGDAKVREHAFGTKGSFKVWKEVIHTAYNYPGQEGLQYLVTTAFAAPLLSLFQQYGGIVVYAHSEGSGVGKTTAQRAGLSAFGDWEQLQLTDKQVTINGLWSTVGAFCNLPVMFDELTNQPNWFASELVFNMSSGQGKVRAKQDGTLQQNNAKWSTIMMASGNTMLTEKVSLHRANADAELSRLFEFSLSNTSRLSPNEAAQLFPKLKLNYGHAGVKFVTYVIQNRSKIEQALVAVQQAFNAEAGIAQQERYWSALQACQLVALKICNKLGILDFPVEPFKAWILEQLGVNRVQKMEVANEPLEIFGRMMADHWQGILVTKGEGDVRKNLLAEVVQHPKGTMHGRAILAMEPNERSMLMLNTATIREWCNKRGCSMKEIFSAVVKAGICDPNQEKYSLGRGTGQYNPITSQVRCWVIDLAKMSSVLDRNIAQRLRVITHGGTDGVADAAAGS